MAMAPPDALDKLKEDCKFRDLWREEGGFADRGPFPQPKTSVAVQEQTRDDETGKAVLRVTATHGDTVYWEVGGTATTASARLDGPTLETAELEVSFLAVDSKGVHETGQPSTWRNRITLKHRIFQSGDGKRLELRAAPAAAIRYTTDGSDPKVAGATYEGRLRFLSSSSAPTPNGPVESEVERIPISWDKGGQIDVDPTLGHLAQTADHQHERHLRAAQPAEQVQGRMPWLMVTIGGEAKSRTGSS